MRASSRWTIGLLVALVCSCAAGGSKTPAPDWPDCSLTPAGPSLAERAAHFEARVSQWHLAPDGLLRNVLLTDDLSEVEQYLHAENTILWSGMYLAAEAFRYAVTHDAAAQDNARRIVAGLTDLTRVTGVSGLYGRSLARPDVTYNFDGHGSPSWTESDAPGYAGWAFRNDVSKDGYDGLMFGYAAALEHFDDEDLLAEIRARVGEIGRHLLDHGLNIVDTDGEVTEHGCILQDALDDYPGFNALLAASWFKVIAAAGADPALDDFYYGCLMGLRHVDDCPEVGRSFGTYVESMESYLYLFQPNCQQNYDNFDMCYQAMYPLLRREQDPDLAARYRAVLRQQMFHTSDPAQQSLAEIGNAFFTFSYAALTGLAPGDDPILDGAVERALCTLRDFPEEKFDRAIPAGEQEEVCRSRLDNPVAADPIPLDEYHFDNYLWRLDFFEIQPARPENRRLIYSPEDFLLAYWMGRYHGLIRAEQ